jgi:hypothetical protein
VPRSRDGGPWLTNLALACPGCSFRKSNQIEAPDPEDIKFAQIWNLGLIGELISQRLQTGKLRRHFNPRIDDWNLHFVWQGYYIVADTCVGRTTAAALNLNNPRRIRIRQAEKAVQLFPPP